MVGRFLGAGERLHCAAMSQDPIELRLEVVLGGGASDDQVDLAARDLRAELIESGFDRVELAEDVGPLPSGAKGGPMHAVGSIALALAPMVVPRLFDLLKEWRHRATGRSFKLKAVLNNRVVEVAFDGLHPDSATAAATQLMEHLRQAQAQGRE
jgi:hypothetical protein